MGTAISKRAPLYGLFGGGKSDDRLKRVGAEVGAEAERMERGSGWDKFEEPESQDSFTDFLPWMEYTPVAKTILLEDGRSVGAVWEIEPIGTEGRDEAFKQNLLDRAVNIVSDTIPELDQRPWVLQVYVQDEPDLTELADQIADYRFGEARGSQFSESFTALMRNHLKAVAREGGLFKDTMSDTNWRGRVRRVRLVLYRRVDNERLFDGLTPDDELNDLAYKLELSLQNAGIHYRRYEGADIYKWLLRWFNPKPACVDGEFSELLEIAPYPGDEELPFGRDFSELLCLSQPRADAARGTIYFDGLPHQVVTTQGLRRPPKPGHFTGENRAGERAFAVFDKMPENTIMALSIVFQPQDLVEAHVSRIQQASVGDQIEAATANDEAQRVKQKMGEGDTLYRSELVFYTYAKDEADLRRATKTIANHLVANDISPIGQAQELLLLDRYLGNLPMAFRPEYMKTNQRARLTFGSHLAAMLPVYGRSRGTGHPGLVFFNRGAEPLVFDPLHRTDRKKNAHALILGPTGAGKSALLVQLIMYMAAAYRPRIFIVEAGNSFGLLADHLAREGLSVHRLQMKPGTDVSLSPFADAKRLVEKPLRSDLTENLTDEDDDEDNEERDVLGEMEIAARIMITGGDAKEEEKLSRSDRLAIRTAIIDAAQEVHKQERDHVLPKDVEAAMRVLSQGPDLTPDRRDRIAALADAIALFADDHSIGGQLFNRPGKPWPDVDVTLVDLATVAREGYEDVLALGYVSLLNHINDVVEQEQHSQRMTLVITDEGHITTTNPLLARFVVKITKMWRKLGAWYWLATQNLEDFPDASRRMLNMMEWWLCLVMPPEEVDQIARFKELNEETKRLLLDARKEPGKYVEGVVLADSVTTIFRSVPPSLCLALAMTEKEEKFERSELMQEEGLQHELDAAYLVADRMAKKRGA